MHISVFNFISVAKPQIIRKQAMGKIQQAKYIITELINWRNPWDKATADIRQKTSAKARGRQAPLTEPP